MIFKNASFDLCYRQIYISPAVKAMHSAAKKSPALRVVFFAAALPANPTRKCFAYIKGQKRRFAEMDWRTDLFISSNLIFMYFTGRLTADAAVRNVKGDRKVTGFNVAINDRLKTKEGEKREITTFVECSYWINPGLAEYLKKGVIVEIMGRVEARAWMKQNEPQANLTCNVSTIKLLGKSNNSGLKRQDTKSKVTNTGADDDDLPF